ncbi:MAG: hypothetical protein ABJL44_19110 [Algibacter sp.]
MKKLLFLFYLSATVYLNAQVSTSSSGRVSIINTDFSFKLTDGQYNRDLIQSGWISGIGDYLSIKHGGGNTEAYTYGIRISDGYGFDFGQNNFAQSFLRIDTNGYVGIGITNPSSKLEVISEIKINAPNTRGNTILKVDRGSEGRDAAVVSFGQNDNYIWNTGLLYNGGSPTSDFYISQNNSIRDASGTIVHLPEFTIKPNGDIGIGTTTPDSKLTVAGKIHAREVKVTIDAGADFVFNDDYKLIPLQEVSQFIKEHKHLPEIASEKDMQENGLHLAEMNIKLLQKIEELTLYTIQQEKEILDLKNKTNKVDALRDKFQNQKAINKSLESRLQKIESLLISAKH